MSQKRPASVVPLTASVGERRLTSQVDAPESFVALYHWCDSNRHWHHRVAVTAFHAAFVGHLSLLKADVEAGEFSRKDAGDGYADGIVDRAQDECLRLAMSSDELTKDWTESRTGASGLKVPANPLRTEADFKAWFVASLKSLPRPGSEGYERPSTALMLWDDYKRAMSWLEEHGYAVPLVDPAEYGMAGIWMNTRQDPPPATRSAHLALAELVSLVEFKVTPSNALTTRSGPVQQSDSRLTIHVDSLASVPASNPPAAPKGEGTPGDELPTWENIERELFGLLTLKQRSLFDPLWKHRDVAVKWGQLKESYTGSKGERAIQVALKEIPKRCVQSKLARVNVTVPSTISRHATVTMTVERRPQSRAEK